jgi:hypothetical protein
MRSLIFFSLITFVLISSFCSAELIITEIMYNPSSEMGSDSDLEWVEIYNHNNQEFDLTGFTINNKKIDSVTIPANSYLVIAKEFIDGKDKDLDSFESCYGNSDHTWNSSDLQINVIDSQSFSLSNTKGTITISDSNYEIATYYEDDFADGDGYSLELINNTWVRSKELRGTPGRENTGSLVIEETVKTIPEEIKLSVHLDNTIYTNLLYDDLFKLKLVNKNNCSEKNYVTVDYYLMDENQTIIQENTFTRENIGCSSYSNTGYLTLSSGGTFNLCGKVVNSDFGNGFNPDFVCKQIKVIDVSKIPCEIFISVLTEKVFYQDGEKVNFYNQLNEKTYPFSIEYWVEDLFGNSVKDKVITINTNKKSYTPKIEEEDRVLFLKARVTPACKDYNMTNNYFEKMLIITNPQITSTETAEGEEDSTIEIKKVTPANKKFGGVVKAEVEIYKGSTGKYSLSAYLEKSGKKISEVTKINLKDKHTNYKVTLPIQLDPNCNLKVKEGKAKLIVSGLDTEDSETIEIEGVDKTLCRDYLSYVKELEKDSGTSSASGSANKLSYTFVNFPEKEKSGKEFDLQVKFKGDDSDHEIKVWAYLYRGSKCYSCCNDCEAVRERDDNLVEFDLNPGEEKTVSIPVIVDSGLESGDYNLKLKLIKDNQKTVRELTTSLIVETEAVIKAVSGIETYAADSAINPKSTVITTSKGYSSKGLVVYESSSEKAKKVIPYLLVIVFGLIFFVLVRKK